jgi:hypothetical protein
MSWFIAVQNMNLAFAAPHLYRESPLYIIFSSTELFCRQYLKKKSYTTEVISITISGIAQTVQAVVRRNLNLLLKRNLARSYEKAFL